jgi:hypothetical protein
MVGNGRIPTCSWVDARRTLWRMTRNSSEALSSRWRTPLRARLDELGRDADELASLAGCSVDTARKAARGLRPGADLRARMAEAVGLTEADLWPELAQD